MLVECPECSKCAKAQKTPSKVYTWTTAYVVTCLHCGYNKVYESLNLKLAPWLKIECQGRWVWAYNYEHLAILKSHVEALLRERNTVPNRNASIGSRLPRWMAAADNRKKVLKCIEKLEKANSH